MTHLIINSWGPAMTGKIFHMAQKVLCYIEDNGLEYESIYLKDTGGLWGPDEGLDWIAIDPKNCSRKKERVRPQNISFNGLDYILDQKYPSSDYIVCPSDFNYKNSLDIIGKDINTLFPKYFKLNKDLLLLVRSFDDKFCLSSSRSLGVHIRTTDINHWHPEAGEVSIERIIEETEAELKRRDYDVLFVSSDNVRESILFQSLFEDRIKVRNILNLTQDFIARSSPDPLHYYNFVKKNYIYSSAKYWQYTFLDFCLLSLCDKKIVRNNSSSGSGCSLTRLSSLLSPSSPPPQEDSFIKVFPESITSPSKR